MYTETNIKSEIILIFDIISDDLYNIKFQNVSINKLFLRYLSIERQIKEIEKNSYERNKCLSLLSMDSTVYLKIYFSNSFKAKKTVIILITTLLI